MNFIKFNKRKSIVNHRRSDKNAVTSNRSRCELPLNKFYMTSGNSVLFLMEVESESESELKVDLVETIVSQEKDWANHRWKCLPYFRVTLAKAACCCCHSHPARCDVIQVPGQIIPWLTVIESCHLFHIECNV